ncbi:helix-turn-helix domain-containing protein [Acinetobacter dispersus]|uniref:helix-turn-helix domain-containing protein n=1 Tax=Acinetobacter dispersus TaxID=70348 RepID=UPI0021CD52C6|nr:helix-turn-helix domain-containing protein [Acinetobacter dispersus]MCU4336042.1 helix-turn-helix domain-containing protein [Acinetobacter dispersus]
MSLDATLWAWRAEVENSSQRLVLLTLADRAGENHKCFPSLKRIEKDTKLNRKTIIKVLDELEDGAFIKFTGKTTGNGVKIYQLIGVVGREDEYPTSTKNGTSPKNGTSTNNGTASSTKNGTATSTNIGTQNLPMNLSLESKNKKHWLCSKKLSEEIAQANPEINPNEIISASWFNREFRAFEKFNVEKSMCDELMIYHFANWLLEAKAKLDRLNRSTQPSKKYESKSDNALTEKQIKFLAGKLSRIPDFGKYAVGNESHEQLAVRLETMLKNPKNIQKWAEYLTAVGFEHKGNAA